VLIVAKQIACQRVFEVTHPGYVAGAAVADHPNHYFDASMKYYREQAAKLTGVKPEPALAAAAGVTEPAAAAATESVAPAAAAAATAEADPMH
jgi:hypothetical protein